MLLVIISLCCLEFSLHFANVSVGTPPLWFMVALDTGSDLFWLPCNCTSCVRGLKTQSGKVCTVSLLVKIHNVSIAG